MTVNPGVGPESLPERRSFRQVKVAPGFFSTAGCSSGTSLWRLLSPSRKQNQDGHRANISWCWILQASLCLAQQQLGETGRRLPSLLSTQHDSDLSLRLVLEMRPALSLSVVEPFDDIGPVWVYSPWTVSPKALHTVHQHRRSPWRSEPLFQAGSAQT